MGTDTKFVAEWIAAQHHDDSGEWIPDDDEYVVSVHATYEAAEKAAIAGSKSANVVEWWAVNEEQFVPELGIPQRSSAAWDTVRRWCGDWAGNVDEVR